MKILAQAKQDEKIAYMICDCCKRRDTDQFEIQEYLSWINVVGYGGAVYDDGDTVSIDLCQYCVKDKLGEWVRVRKPYKGPEGADI